MNALLGSGSEKHEKRARNKDRPDRGIWAPLIRSDIPQASEEHLTPSVSQSAQPTRNHSQVIQGEMKGVIPNGSTGPSIPSENAGSNRHFAQHPTAHNIKDDGSVTLKKGKSSKRGTTSSGASEKQVWVQKSSSVS